MTMPSHADAYQVLWLQLAADGRQEALLGESAQRARFASLPFFVGKTFPSTYLEFPLAGTPFLDVTVLYSELDAGTRIDSDAAEGTARMLDWFAAVSADYPNISCGFELDAHKPSLPLAAVHFQPRNYIELVDPFCEAVGEPEKAKLYHELSARLPESWQLSYFGMFRGRPDSPLRVCGYMDPLQVRACADDPAHLAKVFGQIGFSAYDESMLAQVSTLIAAGPGTIDYQLDIYPDGTLGDAFALDVQFQIEQPAAVCESFAKGPIADVFGLFERWGAADERWKLAADAAFARALPFVQEDGSVKKVSFTLMPQWAKARWRNGVLQPAKLYYFANAGIMESS